MKQTSFRRNLLVCAAMAALGLSTVGIQRSIAADKDSEISTIMKKAFKSSKTKPSLDKKAVDGTATAEELTTLLGFEKDLQKQKPPKGDQKSWDTKTAALVTATESLIKGDKSAAAALKTASSCKDCHSVHKED